MRTKGWWACLFSRPEITTNRTDDRQHHSMCLAGLAIIAGQGDIGIFYTELPMVLYDLALNIGPTIH